MSADERAGVNEAALDVMANAMAGNWNRPGLRAALAALASARRRESCPTCGGECSRNVMTSRGLDRRDCAQCDDDGTVDAGSLLVALLVERGVLEPVGYRHIRVGDLSEFGKWDYVRPESHELVYRVVSPEEPKP